MMRKDYIKFSISPYAASILMIKKSDEELRIYINYRILNALTIKNRNILLLIREILTRLYKVKIYTKFDVIVIFNEIRINENYKEKTAFFTRYKFYEYLIISFELCNTSKTFQIFIN
jgi:hypothetical protein